ncbi:MAG: decarboxylating NADP(+)-dependent phosphogluconate dehydrogenase [Prevotellaceae bacterium]|jgi:6-phosphogluconate dehydrogenase|nr:decarboxylating NADP(+)-dependent phosphogluconate dehydrogenase [Prevotellaceae bacterium]
MNNRNETATIGMIGLAVMGQNLALNMERNGYTVAVWNYEPEVVGHFMDNRGKNKRFIPAYTIRELVESISRPRKIMIMIRAGKPVDMVIEQLLPLLEKGDIIIDGGNSHYEDTARRYEYLKSKGIRFIGSGVSGGEEGALHGPSLMPGGDSQAWAEIKPVFRNIAAKLQDGTPCCDWVGESGAGHFVKMVHNGVEYGDMQLIAEAYHLLKNVGGLSIDELHRVFSEWNKGDLDSYLIEITADILTKKDGDGTPLIEKILDAAGQKGTGKWAVHTALDLGNPLTLIGESVFARSLSALKEERLSASGLLKLPPMVEEKNKETFIAQVKDALYASKIISYTQGFSLFRAAEKAYGWSLNYAGIAQMWRGGCIIRSAFLGKIQEAFSASPRPDNLLLAPFFRNEIEKSDKGWRTVIAKAVTNGIPVPALSSALAYYDGYATAQLPANLIQAQRDYFGAHTYERTDRPRNVFFHTKWTEDGEETASTTYNA